MTPYQYKLYLGMVRLFAAMGTGGAAWTGVRGTSVGLGTPTNTALASQTIRFLESHLIRELMTLPALPIYTAPWWGLASIDVDVLPGDILTNGTIAFLVTGAPDTSQGFQAIPAVKWDGAIPTVIATQAGYRSPLWILGIGA